MRPTAIYRKLMSEEATPFLSFAVDLMRRFMSKADQRTLTMAAIWLVGQCVVCYRRAAYSSRQRVGARRTCGCGN